MIMKISAIVSSFLIAGSIVVPSRQEQPEFGTATYTATVQAPASGALLGDVNGDLEINALDAAIILEDAARVGAGISSVFDESSAIIADVNADSTINSVDAASILLYASYTGSGGALHLQEFLEQHALPVSVSDIPIFNGEPYIVLNDNVPFFTLTEFDTSESFEFYSELDSLGRCGAAVSNVGYDLMPTEDRGSIGMIKPSGWQTIRYDGIVDGGYLYNRCHLIGFQLTGENANSCNLITGTRYLNTVGMLDFENMVADYVVETNHHVMYRVTPIFDGDDPLASGVLMEAISVEDNGKGVCFNVYCYNVQPGISIDYSTGDRRVIGETTLPKETTATTTTTASITGTATTTVMTTKPATMTTSTTTTRTTTTTTVNVPVIPSVVYYTRTGSKYHYLNPCGKGTYFACTLQEALDKGLEPCSKCVG